MSLFFQEEEEIANKESLIAKLEAEKEIDGVSCRYLFCLNIRQS